MRTALDGRPVVADDFEKFRGQPQGLRAAWLNHPGNDGAEHRKRRLTPDCFRVHTQVEVAGWREEPGKGPLDGKWLVVWLVFVRHFPPCCTLYQKIAPKCQTCKKPCKIGPETMVSGPEIGCGGEI